MGKLTLNIHARNPRILLEALGDLVGIHIEQRRVLGQIDQLDGIVLGHMLAALDLNIGSGEQARVNDDDGNDCKHCQSGKDAARDFALALNGRSGTRRMICQGADR